MGEVLQDLQISVSVIVQFQLGKKEQEFEGKCDEVSFKYLEYQYEVSLRLQEDMGDWCIPIWRCTMKPWKWIAWDSMTRKKKRLTDEAQGPSRIK